MYKIKFKTQNVEGGIRVITYIKVCCIFLIINAIGTMIMVKEGEFNEMSDFHIVLCTIIYSLVPFINAAIAFMFIDIISNWICEVFTNERNNSSKEK